MDDWDLFKLPEKALNALHRAGVMGLTPADIARAIDLEIALREVDAWHTATFGSATGCGHGACSIVAQADKVVEEVGELIEAYHLYPADIDQEAADVAMSTRQLLRRAERLERLPEIIRAKLEITRQKYATHNQGKGADPCAGTAGEIPGKQSPQE